MSLDSIPCDLFVDISGTDCALPFSKLSDALEVLLPGQTLMAVSGKQALVSDIPAFCRQLKMIFLVVCELFLFLFLG